MRDKFKSTPAEGVLWRHCFTGPQAPAFSSGLGHARIQEACSSPFMSRMFEKFQKWATGRMLWWEAFRSDCSVLQAKALSFLCRGRLGSFANVRSFSQLHQPLRSVWAICVSLPRGWPPQASGLTKRPRRLSCQRRNCCHIPRLGQLEACDHRMLLIKQRHPSTLCFQI